MNQEERKKEVRNVLQLIGDTLKEHDLELHIYVNSRGIADFIVEDKITGECLVAYNE